MRIREVTSLSSLMIIFILVSCSNPTSPGKTVMTTSIKASGAVSQTQVDLALEFSGGRAVSRAAVPVSGTMSLIDASGSTVSVSVSGQYDATAKTFSVSGSGIFKLSATDPGTSYETTVSGTVNSDGTITATISVVPSSAPASAPTLGGISGVAVAPTDTNTTWKGTITGSGNFVVDLGTTASSYTLNGGSGTFSVTGSTIIAKVDSAVTITNALRVSSTLSGDTTPSIAMVTDVIKGTVDPSNIMTITSSQQWDSVMNSWGTLSNPGAGDTMALNFSGASTTTSYTADGTLVTPLNPPVTINSVQYGFSRVTTSAYTITLSAAMQ